MPDQKRPLPWFGIVLILIGAVLIFGEAFYLDFYDVWDVVWEFWPAVFIFWGVNKYRSNPRDIIFPSVLVVIGLYWIGYNLDLIPYFIEDNFWAFALILFGIYLVFQNKEVHEHKVEADDRDFLDITNVFGSSKNVLDTDNFKGGNVVCAFGGPEIDLRGAKMQEDEVVLHVTILFGGIDLSIPEDWKLVTSCVPIFGGTDDARRFSVTLEQSNKTLIIKGLILFGGIEIR